MDCGADFVGCGGVLPESVAGGDGGVLCGVVSILGVWDGKGGGRRTDCAGVLGCVYVTEIVASIGVVGEVSGEQGRVQGGLGVVEEGLLLGW